MPRPPFPSAASPRTKRSKIRCCSAGGDPRSAIAHGDARDRRGGRRDRHADRRAVGRIARGVLEQVEQDLVDARLVDRDRQRPPGGGSTVTGAAWPRRNVSTVSVTTATRSVSARADREQAEIGARQIHQIVDQPRQPPHLRARERHVGRLDRLAGQQLALGELQRHRQRAERVLDLVRGGAEHRGGIVFVIGQRRRRRGTLLMGVRRWRRSPGRRRCTCWRGRSGRRAGRARAPAWSPCRAPDAPSGWPIAIAPPLTLTRAGSRPSSRTHGIAWAANASFSSIRSRSAAAIPARASAFAAGRDRPEAHQLRLDARDAPTTRSARAGGGRRRDAPAPPATSARPPPRRR